MLCQFCGRPVIGNMIWGAAGPYHPECCRGPSAPQTYAPIPPSADDVAELRRRLEAIERKMAESSNAPAHRAPTKNL